MEASVGLVDRCKRWNSMGKWLLAKEEGAATMLLNHWTTSSRVWVGQWVWVKNRLRINQHKNEKITCKRVLCSFDCFALLYFRLHWDFVFAWQVDLRQYHGNGVNHQRQSYLKWVNYIEFDFFFIDKVQSACQSVLVNLECTTTTFFCFSTTIPPLVSNWQCCFSSFSGHWRALEVVVAGKWWSSLGRRLTRVAHCIGHRWTGM